jgi:hypothetical protein
MTMIIIHCNGLDARALDEMRSPGVSGEPALFMRENRKEL